MCTTNSDLIEQLTDIIQQLSSIPLDYGLGQILLWTTASAIPSNAMILTENAQQLVSNDYLDLYNMFEADNIVFGETFQIPYMTSANTPSPYTVYASSNSDTAWHALNSGTSAYEEDEYWESETGTGTTFTVEFGGYCRIVQLAIRPRQSSMVPTNFRIDGINSDDSLTVIKQYTNQMGWTATADKTFTLPVTDDVYKGIQFYKNNGTGSHFGFIRFIVTLQAPIIPDYFSIPAQPSVPPNGKQWIMITSNA
jgi:hypothetical protein